MAAVKSPGKRGTNEPKSRPKKSSNRRSKPWRKLTIDWEVAIVEQNRYARVVRVGKLIVMEDVMIHADVSIFILLYPQVPITYR
jgi:hypothetical protein